MKRYLKNCLVLALVIVGILSLGTILFFTLVSYTSPVNEAGREYKESIKSYQNDEIEKIDDVFERLEVLDAHFSSPTFNKMQGGEKTEVTLSDIETLFGEPNQIIENVDMNYAETVYQYHYEEMILNIHQHLFSNIDEYVTENFTGVFYDPKSLDQLFVETIINHQSLHDEEDEQFEMYSKEDVSQLIMDKNPTRKIRQSGWNTWPLNQQYYFDDGRGDYSPVEYLSLQFKEGKNETTTELHLMERRYREPYLEKDTQEEIEKKNKALFKFKDIFEEKESNSSNEKFTVKDFSNDFGNIARIVYDFQKGHLQVSWIIKRDKNIKEIRGIVPISESNKLVDINDIADLEVIDFDSHPLSSSDKTLNKDEFIGSK